MIKTHFILGCICLLMFSINGWAQEKPFIENITAEQGLSQGLVYDILQDQEGFLWFGTKDGLNRYDGYHFEIFTNNPNDTFSISGNTIRHLFEDSKGRIWIAIENGGLDIYDKRTGRFYQISHDPQNPASLSGNNISSIVEDTSGYFVVVVADKEINMFQLEDDFFAHQKSPQIIRVSMPPQEKFKYISDINIREIKKDALGRIWVGGRNSIYQLDVAKAQLSLALEGFSFDYAYANSDGSLWLSGGEHFILHWNGNAPLSINKNLLGSRGIQVDNNEMLFCISPESLYSIDLKLSEEERQMVSNVKSFGLGAPNQFLQTIPPNVLKIDRSGIVWVGSNGFGIFKLNPNLARFSHLAANLSVREIIATEQEVFVQDFNLFWLKENGKYLREEFPDSFKNYSFQNLLITSSGDYLLRYQKLGTLELVLKQYNPKTKAVKRIATHLYDFSREAMIQAKDGTIWMTAANSQLSQLNLVTGEMITYSLKDGEIITTDLIKEKKVEGISPTSLYEDAEGLIWIGTQEGLIKCERNAKNNPIKLTRYENEPAEKKSLSYNHVTCFLDDPNQPNQFLWVCTKGGGINRMDKKKGTFLRLTKKDGLPDDVVYGVLADEEGNIWGSTNKGIFCMIPQQDRNKQNEVDAPNSYVFRNFSKADGLQGEEFNTGAFAKLPDGRLAFGGVNGYNVFDPKEILTDKYDAPVFITNIFVNNVPIKPNDETGILKNTIETTSKITLTHLQDILTLEFASLDFNFPTRNKYRYQLVGVDDTWVESGNRRTATFLHLPPRTYTFRVQGSNSQGIWGSEIAALEIMVLPPWWNTWWAYLIYFSLLLSLVAWIFLFFTRREKLKQQLSFEKREAERVRELDIQKTQLYMNMTHEFRTPLTIIMGMAKQVKENPKKELNERLDMIIRNGQSLLGLVNQMLSLSKLEDGKMTLDLTKGDIVSFLRELLESFQSLLANKKIQLHFLSEINTLTVPYDEDKLQQIISNLISNAYKFTPAGGNIYFTVRIENEALVLRVKDTGKGIPAAELESIFTRFYQVDNTMTRAQEGTGIGLSLTKELVKLMQGEIEVQSPPIGATKGSEFIVRLPIDKKELLNSSKKMVSDFAAQPLLEKQQISETENVASNPITTIDTSKVGIESKTPSTKPLILLVEDNADVVAYVASCLPNYRLAVGENGKEGFEIATDMIPDLIITDVMMPIMDGFEFCGLLKKDERTNHIPVIMLTAKADFESKLEGLELGANAYLAKPFEKKELLLNIKNLFKLRDNLKQHYLQLAGLKDSASLENQAATVAIIPQQEDNFVIKVRTIIETHLEDTNFNVEQLAKNLHLSPSQLRRKLDALIGRSPNQMVRRIRLEKAKVLMRDKDLNITAVAYSCGFNDPSYFSRVFKKEFGITPLEWREEEVKKR